MNASVGKPITDTEERILSLYDHIEELKREIRYLRTYGNKDCTAMADAAMKKNELENEETIDNIKGLIK